MGASHSFAFRLALMAGGLLALHRALGCLWHGVREAKYARKVLPPKSQPPLPVVPAVAACLLAVRVVHYARAAAKVVATAAATSHTTG